MHFSMIALGHGDPSTNHVDVAFVFVTRYKSSSQYFPLPSNRGPKLKNNKINQKMCTK